MEEEKIEVLLVEDNPLHRYLLKGVLEEINQGYQVRIEGTLAAGIKASHEGDFDVVLLDLVLPDGRGLETFLRWKAEGAEIPVVVLTGLDDMDLATRAVESGAEDYLLKNQINPALLARALRYAVERGQVKNREWDSPQFRRAHHQIMKAAEVLGLGEELRKGLLYPHRATFSTIPIWRGEEYLNVSAYRVQHLPGPTRGPLRWRQAESLGEVTSRAMEMSWKCALFCPEYGGAAGAVWWDRKKFDGEQETKWVRSQYLAELGPEDEVDPDLGPDRGLDRVVEADQEGNEKGIKLILKVLEEKEGREIDRARVRVLREEENALTALEASGLEAKVVVEAVVGAILPEADEILREREIVVIPDFLATAGGLLGRCFPEERSEKVLKRELGRAVSRAWERGQRLGLDLRTAALVEAMEVIEARHFRGEARGERD